MEHNEAMENHTAERYLLHELTEQERDAYEEHFFSCSACAEEIKAASEFMENARKVVQDELKAHIYSHVARRSIFGSWLNFRMMLHPIPAAACVLLVAVSAFGIYQNAVTIPQLTKMATTTQHAPAVQAQLVPPSAFVLSESRSGEPNLVTVRRGKPFRLQFDVPVTGFNAYQADVTTDSGIKKFTIVIPQEMTSAPVQILVPPSESGNYLVVIQGVNTNGTESGVKGEAVRLPFHLNIQD